MTRTFRSAALLASAALGLGLGGCKIDNRPLLARGETAVEPVYAGAPAPGPLEPGPLAPGYAAPAPAAYLSPPQAYAYPRRAYALRRAVYDAPPSYAFGYGGEEPWVWDVADQGQMFAEPVDDGWRYYYYDPGEPYPYFVQDPGYGYAYGDNGALVAIFDAAGALVGADNYGPYEYRARDYWRRGYDLDRTYQASPRRAVDERAWRQRAPQLAAYPDRWFQAAAAQPAWAAAGAYAPRHDNGRHLGWWKDQGRGVVQAPAPAAPRFAPAQPAQPWREARQAQRGWTPPAPMARGGGVERAHGPAPQRFARAEPPPAIARMDRPLRPEHAPGANHPAPPAQAIARIERPQPAGRGPQAWGGGGPHGGPGGHEFRGGQSRGGQPAFAPAVAMGAEAHGRAAAARAPVQAPQPPGQPGGHGGQGRGGQGGGGKNGGGHGNGGGPHGHGPDHG